MDTSIAEVTGALRLLLENELGKAVPGAIVTLNPPSELPPEPAINLYLYRVSENVARMGPVLSYLVTPTGGPDREHAILDVVLRVLRQNPILEIGDARADLTSRDLPVEDLLRMVVPYRLSVAYDVRILD